MRIMIANDDASFRLALRMYFQTQEDMTVVSEVVRTGELLRDAPIVNPDLILLDWNLPDSERFSMSGHQNKATGTPNSNQIKAVIISALHNLESTPMIIVTDNRQENLLSALYSGADAFLYQGDTTAKLITVLESILEHAECKN